MPKRAPVEERFWARVQQMGAGCWHWTGAIGSHGYGVIGNGPHSTITTHRLSWQLAYGRPVPEGLFVLHRCDNRKCVRPDHLYLGDARQNSADVRERGDTSHWDIERRKTPELERRRVAALKRGAEHHRSNAKLTEQEAVAVRAAQGSQREIAARFGICQQTVSLIKQGKLWRHTHADA